MRQYYYIPFIPKAHIDYIHLFSFYDIAEYRIETKAFDLITYNSLKELSIRLGIAYSTLNRILQGKENYKDYSKFMEIDKKNKCIYLKCSFPKGEKASFVRITAAEVKLIRDYKDNNTLLAKYLIYIKYYCIHSKNKKNNFTATQFLEAFDYSTKSNANFDKISAFNSLLVKKNIIKIERYIDELGHKRNIYSLL